MPKNTTNSNDGPAAIEPRKLTARENHLIIASSDITIERPSYHDMAFLHAIMCQVGLPRSKPKTREFLRKSGDTWLYVQAGVLDEGSGPVAQPVPYGPMPRLALAWISTFAVRHKEQEIPIGHSAAEFLRLMGMDSQGTRYSSLRKQMHALAACRLQYGCKGITNSPAPLIETFVPWLSNKDTGQLTFWPGVLCLSDEYFKTLLEHAVPLDSRALYALKGSALALDVYTWLAHRLCRMEKPIMLTWDNLREQFGQEYQGKDPNKDFKRRFLEALQAVLLVYPQAKVKQATGGVMLTASPPPIAPKTRISSSKKSGD